MKTDRSTRSAKVFAAEGAIANPFLLCRVVAVYARRLQGERAQFADSINKSFRLISDLPRGHMDSANLPLLHLQNYPAEPADGINDKTPAPEELGADVMAKG